MKKFFIPFICCLYLLNNNLYSQKIDYKAFGTLPGKDSAILFAPGFINKTDKFQRVTTFSPDGKELYFTTVDKGFTNQKIWVSKYVSGKWQEPVPTKLSQEYAAGEPSISPDGKRMFFVTNRPPADGWNFDIWYVNKTDTGWSEPVRLDENINTGAGEWHPCVAKNGDLYFASDKKEGSGGADLYFSTFENGKYMPAKNLGEIVNSPFDDWDPYVSPNNDYIIFKSNRTGGFGAMDMYITVKKNKQWTTPQNLGKFINSDIVDDAGDVTPDGKYLIFARKKAWESMNIYWISMDAILPLLK